MDCLHRGCGLRLLAEEINSHEHEPHLSCSQFRHKCYGCILWSQQWSQFRPAVVPPSYRAHFREMMDAIKFLGVDFADEKSCPNFPPLPLSRKTPHSPDAIEMTYCDEMMELHNTFETYLTTLPDIKHNPRDIVDRYIKFVEGTNDGPKFLPLFTARGDVAGSRGSWDIPDAEISISSIPCPVYSSGFAPTPELDPLTPEAEEFLAKLFPAPNPQKPSGIPLLDVFDQYLAKIEGQVIPQNSSESEKQFFIGLTKLVRSDLETNPSKQPQTAASLVEKAIKRIQSSTGSSGKEKKSSTKKLPGRLTDPFKKTKSNSDSGAPDLPKKTFLASSQIHENQEASDVFDVYLDRIEPTHTRQKSTYSLHFKGTADSNQTPEEAEDPQEPDVFDQYLDKIETW